MQAEARRRRSSRSPVLVAVGTALIASSASCGGAAARRSSEHATSNAAAAVLGEGEVRHIVEAVAAARQLPARRPIHTNRVDRKTFVSLVRQGFDVSSDQQGMSASDAFLLSFNLVPPPDARANLARASEVLEEQIAGFYDPRQDAIVVPLLPITSAHDALTQRAVLAHETEHALQHQHFPPRSEGCERDACLAELALFEGDAMVAMGSYLGSEQGEPIGRTLRRITDVTRDVSLDRLSGEHPRSALDRAAPILRKELEFPYVEGMLFVSDLYRAGGFPLVDEAFRSPPKSTMHILHPDKYLAGIEPRTFNDVAAGRGQRRVTSGVMGEMLTRTLLGQCLDEGRAARVTSGWAGDRYTIFTDDRRDLSFGWVSSWSTTADAEGFERAVRDAGACFAPNRLGAAEDYSIGSEVRVTRSDRIVAVTRNVDAAQSRALERSLFASAAKEAEARPRSSAHVPPREPLPSPRPGHLRGDLYVNEWVGLAGRVPAGMRASVDHDGMDLVISRSDVIVHGGLAVSTRLANREQNERTLQGVYEGFRAALSKTGLDLPIRVRSSGPIRTALGDALERTWGAGDTPLELRMVLVPICAGTGSVVFVQVYADPYARSVLDGWMQSFRFGAGRNLEACAYLDPK